MLTSAGHIQGRGHCVDTPKWGAYNSLHCKEGCSVGNLLMASTPIQAPARVIRFGLFEVDLDSNELRKKGLRLKLQDQPLSLLRVLLEHPGTLVTRDDLRNRLWKPGTFVEFDHSLNTAMMRLREVLGDSSDNPTFIETVPRKGYRFIAPVHEAEREQSPLKESGQGTISTTPPEENKLPPTAEPPKLEDPHSIPSHPVRQVALSRALLA